MAAVLAGLALLAVACGSSTEGGAGAAAADGSTPQQASNPALVGQATPSPEATEPAQATGSAAGGEIAARTASGDLSARTADGEQTTQAQQPGAPVSVSIPAIGVKSRLVRLGLNDDRSMEVPDSFGTAGWYVHGPQPGEVGPAVIAGHVSSEAGPAVFYRLRELEPGDTVRVTRATGERVAFTVNRVEQHPKADFPTEEVYGDTDEPALRLITCGGVFDEQADSHRDNIIVFATKA